MSRPFQFASLVVLVLATAACGAARTDATAPDGSDTLIARPGGPSSALVGYDAAGAVRFRLPEGISSSDGRRLLATAPSLSGTELVRYDARSGRELGRRSLTGRWRLAAVSADGTIAALAAPPAGHGTNLTVVRATARPHAIRLSGRFDVDAVSSDGRSLFLIERQGDERYAVRLYDLAADRLVTGSIRPKNEDEEMVGVAGSQVGTPDGTWLLTLYVNTEDHEAFVHALNLRKRYALCLDLPGEGVVRTLRGYGLALARDGHAVFAANPRLGTLAEVGLRNLGSVRQLRFPRAAADARATAVSPDGRTLYVAGGTTLWRYDLAAERPAGTTRLGAEPAALVFGADGARLYAVGANGVTTLDAVTG